VVFLDIAMPGGSGFDLLARRRVDAWVVFVTAYEAHAVRAFEVNALDYLVKPVEPERLAATVSRLAGRPPGPRPDRICLPDDKGVRVVAPSQIVWVEADRDYTHVHLREGSAVVVKSTLARWEARLGEAFLRVHRGVLVSLADVVKIERASGSSYRLFLRGRGEEIAVSRAHAGALKAALGRWGR
jgi:two-component system LytT family response regulator